MTIKDLIDTVKFDLNTKNIDYTSKNSPIQRRGYCQIRLVFMYHFSTFANLLAGTDMTVVSTP